tara:strand:+ start:278 stop:583 length:306 start_codon:yes stop_codon:yes gene_type:complete
LGHIIGLHSYSHPTDLKAFLKEEQKTKYRKNFDHFSLVLGSKPRTVSHPCNSYDEKTLEILKELEVTIGFRSNINQSKFSLLEFLREDHAIIMNKVLAKNS